MKYAIQMREGMYLKKKPDLKTEINNFVNKIIYLSQSY